MAMQFNIGDEVINAVQLPSDQGPIAAGKKGMIDDVHASASKNLYIVRFVNLEGPDWLAPAFQDQLKPAP